MLSTDNKNFKISALALSAMIAGVEAQTVTCTSTSPQCCWVVRSWQLMGQFIPTGIKSTDNSCCTVPMSGVFCDSTKTKVTGLDWSSKALTGSIPADIGKLTSLTSLSLGDNQLSGSIPSGVGNLKSLTSLNVSNNQLLGTIPSTIGNLLNLQQLVLNNNQLVSPLPSSIGNLKKLQGLILSRNSFREKIPLWIGNLISLRELDGSENEFSILPRELKNLINLERILFNNNPLSCQIPPEIGKLINLKVFYFVASGLSGTIPPEIGDLANLTYFNVFWNDLVDPIPKQLGNLTKLNSLTLGGNFFSYWPSELGNLANLVELNGNFPPWALNLKKLERVENTWGSGWTTFPDIRNMTSLKSLDLMNNGITELPEWVGSLPNLTDLNVQGNHLSSLPSNIGTWTTLRNLWVGGSVNGVSNPLSGTVKPPCSLSIYAEELNLTVCGCAAKSSPPVILPDATNLECLSSGFQGLTRRGQVFTQSLYLQNLPFTCTFDYNKNPFQDCLNTITAFCFADTVTSCKTVVDQIARSLNPYWAAIHSNCAKWQSTYSPTGCYQANSNLMNIDNAYYAFGDKKIAVTQNLIESINQNLWNRIQ